MSKTLIDEEFYLIKKNIISEIKNENLYIQYRTYFAKLNKYKFIGEREKYLLIKKIPKDDLKNLSKLKYKKHKHQQQGMAQINQANLKYEVDITPIQNPINSNEIYYIGNDFELIEKNCAEFLFNDIKQKPHNKILCSFVSNNIIIFHYPKNTFNNNKYDMCVISEYIENKKVFKNDYLIKYNSNNFYQHILIKSKII